MDEHELHFNTFTCYISGEVFIFLFVNLYVLAFGHEVPSSVSVSDLEMVLLAKTIYPFKMYVHILPYNVNC